MTIRTLLLTASALILATACNPSATQAPAEAPAPAAPIADPTTPAPSGPAAENTTDSLSSTPAAPAAPEAAAAAPAAPSITVANSPTLEEIATAKTAYAATCAMCHGPAGQGTQMGVTLANIHDVAAIKDKVNKGMVKPGDKMPPMGAALTPASLDALAKYIAAGLPQ